MVMVIELIFKNLILIVMMCYYLSFMFLSSPIDAEDEASETVVPSIPVVPFAITRVDELFGELKIVVAFMVLSEVPELPTLAMVENLLVLEPIEVVTLVSSVPMVDAIPVVVISVVTLEEVSPSNNT